MKKIIKIEIERRCLSADHKLYYATALEWNGQRWTPTALAIKDTSPTQVYHRMLTKIFKKGWWK